MLLILADVYRIATFRADQPQAPRQATQNDTERRRNWLRFAGLLR
jgi:hypothetical protein